MLSNSSLNSGINTEQKKPQPVWFEFRSAHAREVALVGEFDPWRGVPMPMAPAGRGKWIRVLFLYPGRYQYGYLVDGQPATMPSERADSFNRLVLVVKPLGRRLAIQRSDNEARLAA